MVPQMRTGVGRILRCQGLGGEQARAGTTPKARYGEQAAPAPRLEVMRMKRADLGARAPNRRPRRKRVPAMRKENTRWNPSHWTQQKARRFRNHAMDYTIESLRELLGDYNGTLAFAELRGKLADEESARHFADAGVKTLRQGGE